MITRSRVEKIPTLGYIMEIPVREKRTSLMDDLEFIVKHYK
jgi:hypothetical protein